ncbi:MAG: hypothetical protein ABH867_00675 [Patescibacteria group bacterium]|nr:hypothetical protein [Patescibacteria group bacterium]
MVKTSRLLKILSAAEEILLFFDNYFSKYHWVAYTAGYTPKQFNATVRRLNGNNSFDSDFSFKKPAGFSLSMIKEDWDGNWRVVSYDIPEKSRVFRDLIKRSLYDLGFKKMQRSVWISPLPVDRFVRDLAGKYKTDNFAFFLAKMPDRDPRKIVTELWPVFDWRKEAVGLLAKLKKAKEASGEDKNKFWQLVLNHPKVPLDLLPVNWPLKELTITFSSKNREKED